MELMYVTLDEQDKIRFICPIDTEKNINTQCRMFLAENSFPNIHKNVHTVRKLTNKEKEALEEILSENDDFWDAQSQVCYRTEDEYMEFIEIIANEKQIEIMGESVEENPLYPTWDRPNVG